MHEGFEPARVVDTATAMRLTNIKRKTWIRLRASGEGPPAVRLSTQCRAMGHAATCLHLNRRDAVERASASLLAASRDNEAKGCCQLRPCKRIGITLSTIT
jgi:hypothetical protein